MGHFFKTREQQIVYLLLCFGCVTISFNIAAISAVIPVISLDLQLPDFRVAQIIPFYLVPYGIGALMYAPLTRFVHYRRVLLGTMLLYALSCWMCGRADSLTAMLIFRIGMGVTAASAIPLGLMLIGEVFEKQVRGRLVGMFFSCSFFASLAGIMLSGVAHWRWLFFAPAVMGGGLALWYVFFHSDLLNKVHVGRINYFKAFQNRDILKVFAFIFMISFLYHGVHKWYGIYLSRIYHLDQLAISFFFTLAAIAGFIGQISGGVISDKLTRETSWRIGVTGLGLFIMLLVGRHSLVVLGIVLFAISMFWTIGHNGVSTVLTDFSDEDRPIISSLNSSVRFISGGLGFSVSSFFVEKSFAWTFLGIGLVMLVLAGSIKKFIPKT